MKTRFYIISVFLLAGVIALNSCAKDDTPTALNAEDVKPELLLGTWRNAKNSNDFKKYTSKKVPPETILTHPPDQSYAYGSGWLIGETVEDKEGTEFYWKIIGNQIYEQYPNMETYMQRIYTISQLTEGALSYFDVFNEETHFVKHRNN